MRTSSHEPAIRMQAIQKRYGSVLANQDIHLEIAAGSIHGILGENGAGKSTAMKILYGMVEPDSGTISIDGKVCRFKSPLDARAVGIGMVHQHFMLADEHSVLENIILGQEPVNAKQRWLPESLASIDWQAAERDLNELMRSYAMPLPLHKKAAELSLGERQRAELLRLLYGRARILILDEPTAVLAPLEIDRLFEQLKRLAEQGRTILIVTHKLKELLTITEQVSIFRQGRVIETVRTASTDADSLASKMIGRRYVALQNEERKSRQTSANRPLLTIKELNLRPQIKSHNQNSQPDECLSLAVWPGEIVGIAGIENNGQHELGQVLRHPHTMLKDHQCDELSFLGRDMRRWSCQDSVDAGIGHIPADRHREGLALDLSALDNFLLGLQNRPEFSMGPFIRWSKVRSAAHAALTTAELRPLNLKLNLRAFSGGNQQKLIFARETYAKPKLLVAMHPTRGVDVGAIQSIHRQLLELRSTGAGILLISSEIDEILALSDRILVLENYRLCREFAGAECDEAQLGLAMSGQKQSPSESGRSES